MYTAECKDCHMGGWSIASVSLDQTRQEANNHLQVAPDCKRIDVWKGPGDDAKPHVSLYDTGKEVLELPFIGGARR